LGKKLSGKVLRTFKGLTLGKKDFCGVERKKKEDRREGGAKKGGTRIQEKFFCKTRVLGKKKLKKKLKKKRHAFTPAEKKRGRF